jgi:predicted AlkP superfamily pyrophosphatase or phosphodiesterase
MQAVERRGVGKHICGGIALLLASAAAVPVQAVPVLLISIDGLRPGDVIEARKRGLDLPNLSRLLAEGSHARGVTGVLPTFTLPSHVTLVTGTSPARHGIVNNVQFWPQNQSAAQYYNFGSDIQVPTLWDVAHAKGIVTASVNWPVSLGAKGIDHIFSVYAFPPTGQPNDATLLRLLNGPKEIDALQARIGPIHLARREGVADEAEDARIAAAFIALYRPGLTTVHFGALDEAEHNFGPGSPEAKAALKGVDALVGQLVAAQRAAAPDSVVAIVSDHGFTAVKTEINLPRAFLDAGLITQDGSGKVTSWEAIPWPAGGSAAIILARADDQALKDRVAALLARLKADPAVGIEEVVGPDEIARRGGFPGASFLISYRLDTTGAVRPLSQALVAPARQKGTHGHAASYPELQSTFIVAGPGVARSRDLGVIDIRAIAPTLARLLGTDLPQADLPPIDLSSQ